MKLTSHINWPTDTLLIISLISSFGAATYWLIGLGRAGQILTWLATAITYLIIYRKRTQSKKESTDYNRINWTNWPLLTLIIIALAYLFGRHSNLPLQSPWTQVDGLFWIIYWLIAAIGLWSLKTGRVLAKLTIISWWLLTFSLASLIYFSAFGFDPFVHQATEKTILNQGQIQPKTPYYIGQYAVVISLSRLTGLSIGLIERWLIPLLAAIFITWLAVSWSTERHNRPNSQLLVWLFPLLGWSIFMVTTPQNCAYFFLAATSLLAISKQSDRPLLWATALASAACQPLAGIPAITAAILASLKNHNNRQAVIGRWLASSLTGFILPLSLWYANWQQTKAGRLVVPSITELSTWLNSLLTWSKLWPNQESWLLNLIYGWQAWQPLTIISLIIAGWLSLRRRSLPWNRIIKPLNLALIAAFLLTSLIPFDFVISYERYNYLQRFWWLALIINLPAILLASGQLAKNWLLSRDKMLHWPIIIALASLLTFSLYLTYPRVDNYSNAKGLSVGLADLTAVRWIEDNAPQDYVVLANQQVGAAALGEYGFYPGKHQRYLKNQIFYYPIPTSGILYRHYLEMVDNYPSRSAMLEAVKLAGVKYGYLVLNNYWYGFEKIAQEAAAEADTTTRLADGQIIIFSYDFSKELSLEKPSTHTNH